MEEDFSLFCKTLYLPLITSDQDRRTRPNLNALPASLPVLHHSCTCVPPTAEGARKALPLSHPAQDMPTAHPLSGRYVTYPVGNLAFRLTGGADRQLTLRVFTLEKANEFDLVLNAFKGLDFQFAADDLHRIFN